MVTILPYPDFKHMTLEQLMSVSHINVSGMIIQCSSEISESEHAIWSGKEWQPYYQSRIEERDVSGFADN